MTSEKHWLTPSWYVVHTHPKQEDRAANNLKAWGVETFTPKVKSPRRDRYTGQVTQVSKPLFPRYMFAWFKFSDISHKLRFTRGVHSLVSFNGGPSPIDEQIIATIRSRIDSNGFVRIGEELKPGDEVVIKDGPFQNFSGIFDREMKEADRVRILLNTVSYQSHIVVDKELVTRVC